MEESNILELINKFSDKNNLKNDIKEILSLTSDLFKRKYIDTLKLEINNHLEIAQKNPTKEIHLLQSLKPFLKENKSIDKFIDTMVNISAFNNIKTKLTTINNPQNLELKASNFEEKNTPSEIISNIKDESIKPDGVYDIDEECLYSIQDNKKEKPNTLLILIVFLLIFNK